MLILLAPLLPDVEVDVELRDPSDSPVVGAAVGARAEAIVTGDADLLEDPEVRAWLREREIAVLARGGRLERLGGS